MALGPDRWLGLIGCLARLRILHYGLWTLKIVKAGDAKLMMGVGACVGWAEMLETTAWWALLHIPFSLMLIAVRGKFGNLVATAKHVYAQAMGHPTGEPPEQTKAIAGPIIAVSGIVASLTDWLAWPT